MTEVEGGSTPGCGAVRHGDGEAKVRQGWCSASPLETDPPALAAPASLALPGLGWSCPSTALPGRVRACDLPCVLSSALAALLPGPDFIRKCEFLMKGDECVSECISC